MKSGATILLNMLLAFCLAGTAAFGQQNPAAGKKTTELKNDLEGVKNPSLQQDSVRIHTGKQKLQNEKQKIQSLKSNVTQDLKSGPAVQPKQTLSTLKEEVKSDVGSHEKDVNVFSGKSAKGAEQPEVDAVKNKGKTEKAEVTETIDTIRHPNLKQKTRNAFNRQKYELKTEYSQFKSGFKVSKFSDLKVDTGNIPLDHQGLMNRGSQFLKSNTSASTLPTSFPTKFNSNNVTNSQLLKPVTTLPDAVKGESNVVKGDVSKIENLQHKTLNANELENNASSITKKFEQSDNKIVKTVGSQLNNVSEKDIFSNGKVQLPNAKKIYSDKYIKKMTDSLGLHKADSLFQVASPLIKQQVSKDQLLQTINQSVNGKTKSSGISMSGDKLTSSDQSKLNGIPNQFAGGDLSKMQLLSGVLQELQPLRGSVVDDKYLKIVDSMKNVNLKAQRLKMSEQNLSSNLKSVLVKDKPTFAKKSYVEGILGFYQSGKFTVFHASPSLGYHFTENLSVGFGPSILVQVEDKQKLASIFGFRYFTKVEVYKHRAYLQVEDNMNPTAFNKEIAQNSIHNVLAGGGVLLPISKKLALNPCLLYKVNTDHTTGASPWVFRIGLSSIKPK